MKFFQKSINRQSGLLGISDLIDGLGRIVPQIQQIGRDRFFPSKVTNSFKFAKIEPLGDSCENQ